MPHAEGSGGGWAGCDRRRNWAWAGGGTGAGGTAGTGTQWRCTKREGCSAKIDSLQIAFVIIPLAQPTERLD